MRRNTQGPHELLVYVEGPELLWATLEAFDNVTCRYTFSHMYRLSGSYRLVILQNYDRYTALDESRRDKNEAPQERLVAKASLQVKLPQDARLPLSQKPCTTAESSIGSWVKETRTEWRWTAHHCQLATEQAIERFDACVHRRTLLFVGDATLRALFMSVFALRDDAVADVRAGGLECFDAEVRACFSAAGSDVARALENAHSLLSVGSVDTLVFEVQEGGRRSRREVLQLAEHAQRVLSGALTDGSLQRAIWVGLPLNATYASTHGAWQSASRLRMLDRQLRTRLRHAHRGVSTTLGIQFIDAFAITWPEIFRKHFDEAAAKLRPMRTVRSLLMHAICVGRV